MTQRSCTPIPSGHPDHVMFGFIMDSVTDETSLVRMTEGGFVFSDDLPDVTAIVGGAGQ